jgi:outer membrane protein
VSPRFAVVAVLLLSPPAIANDTPSSPPAAEQSPYLIDLATTLHLAGAKSIDIQIANERVRAAEALHESAVMQFIPWLSVGTNYRRHTGLTQDVVGNIVPANKDAYAVNGSINLQVDVGESLFRALAAHQVSQAAEQSLDVQRQETLLRAAQVYFDLLIAQANEVVAADALAISQEYESQLHRAVDAGIALKGDELRVAVQTRRNRIALQQASEQKRIVAARLAEGLRLDPAVELLALDTELAPLEADSPLPPVADLVREAIASRPELRDATASAQAAAELEKGAQYGSLIPTVYAQAIVGTLGGGRDGGPTNSGAARDYVAGVAWRIGPGGLFDASRIGLARARRAEADWNTERVRDSVALQVVEARIRVLSQRDQLATAKEALTAAGEALKLARGRKEFEVGVVLENILAEQDLTRARQDYARAIGESDKAQYALDRALGRLGSTSDASARP